LDGKELERGEKLQEATEQPRTLSRLGLAKDYHQQPEPSGGGRFNKFQVRFLEIKNISSRVASILVKIMREVVGLGIRTVVESAAGEVSVGKKLRVGNMGKSNFFFESLLKKFEGTRVGRMGRINSRVGLAE
jgi:hypothetical protein